MSKPKGKRRNKQGRTEEDRLNRVYQSLQKKKSKQPSELKEMRP